MGDKLSGKNIVGTIILVIIMIVVLLAVSFFSIINGIVGIVKEFFNSIKQAITESETWGKILDKLGVSKVKEGMNLYLINEQQVESLKSNMESVSVDTEKSGLTEVRLRKILLAYAVSSSFSDTLCAVPVTEEEIVANIKEKDYGRDFNTIDDFISYCNNNGKAKNSKDVWPISKPNYKLYYDSEVFFYFKATNDDEEAGFKKDQWYLGAMGATTLTTSDGTQLSYFDSAGFAQLKEKYEKLSDTDKEGSTAEKQLLTGYTKINANTIKVYKIITTAKEYDYIFENKNIKTIKLNGTDKTSSYKVETVDISLEDKIDMSNYAIPVELMVDLLNITGSGEFLEEFIDYSLEKINVTAKAYTTMTSKYRYSKQEYNIKSDFVLEAYDIIDLGTGNLGDIGNDNFKAYKDIVFGRKYEGRSFERITDLNDFESITYNEKEYGEGLKYSVDYLYTYLKTAYNPGPGFDLGEIKVTEVVTDIEKENNWEFAPSKISTWYGEINYSDPVVDSTYAVPTSSGEAKKEEFDNFGYDDLKDYKSNEDEKIERVYLSDTLNEQSPVSEENGKTIHIVPNGSDLYDGALNTKLGEGNKSHYWNWTANGLINIAINDGSEEYNNSFGPGTGCDYIYTKYTKNNIKQYEEKSKSQVEILNTSNVTKSSSNIDKQLREFLELLKNNTGKIPTSVGSEGGFKKDGIVVKYGDIYRGHIEAGDLLLDNGALMLFDLLESAESTQGLVNVFKYLAYLYSGVDYGITDVSQIAYLLATDSYNGSDFIVNSGMSSKEIVLKKEQLKQAIEKSYSGKTKENLLSCLDDFMYIQSNNNVNAIFAVAVTIVESGGGTNWAAIDSSTHNWMSVTGSYNGNSYKNPNSQNPRVWRVYPSFNEATRDFGDLIANGSYYFKAGKYSVKEIATSYCPGGNWDSKVISEMTKMYSKIGISVNTGGTEGTAGNVTTFTVGNRTYKNYKQIEPSYKSIPLANFPGSNLHDSGCAVTSVAIIATGFGKNVDPIAVNNYEKEKKTTVHSQVISYYTGTKCTWINSDLKNGIVSQLRKGYPVMVEVKKNYGTFHTETQHYFTILSISEDGNSIYVSDPASRRDGVRTGWLKTSVLDEPGFHRYLKMEGK